MISYDHERERWVSDEDDKTISMTPEGPPEELEQTFENWDEFYLWYYRGDIDY